MPGGEIQIVRGRSCDDLLSLWNWRGPWSREKKTNKQNNNKTKKQKNHDGWNFIAVVVVSLSSIAQLFFVFLFFSTRFQMKFCNFLDLFCFVFKLFFIYFIFGCVDDVKRKTVRHQTIRHLSVQRSSNNNPKKNTNSICLALCENGAMTDDV